MHQEKQGSREGFREGFRRGKLAAAAAVVLPAVVIMALTGCLQKIDKIISGFAHVAYTVF